MYYVAWLSSFVFHWCVLLPTCMQNLIRQARQIYGVIFAISNATPCCCFCSTRPAPNQPPISGGIYKNCQTKKGRNIAGNFVDYSQTQFSCGNWQGSTLTFDKTMFQILTMRSIQFPSVKIQFCFFFDIIKMLLHFL